MGNCHVCGAPALTDGLCVGHHRLIAAWGAHPAEAIVYRAWVLGGRIGDWPGVVSHIGMMLHSTRPTADDRVGWQAQLEDLCYFLRVRPQ